MIKIKRSPTAGLTGKEFQSVPKDVLADSVVQHRNDVYMAIKFFIGMLGRAATYHDEDKIQLFEQFRKDFESGFQWRGWLNHHCLHSRHHLNRPAGIPEDINLIDVLEYIVDCVVSGMARSGHVFPVEIKPETLGRAFENTIDLLKKNIELEGGSDAPESQG